MSKCIGFVPSYQYHYVMHRNSATHAKNSTIRLTSVEVMKRYYLVAKTINNKIEKRMRELYIKELASCIKDILGDKNQESNIKRMQKEIRNNLKAIWTNKDFRIIIKLAIVCFSLPYKIIYYLWRGLMLVKHVTNIA